MPFDDIMGQARPLNILRRMLGSKTVAHAFLFSGAAGVGKSTTAMAFARALNCTQLSADFCGTCPSCKKIESGVHPDLFLISPEKNIIKIDQIRSLQDTIVFAPLAGAWRVIIIDRAECMNREAANCLLKTLEEPPPATVLILVAHGSARLLPTVLSRCQIIAFSPLPLQAVTTLLEREGIPPDKALAVAAHAHGSLQRARLLLNDGVMEEFARLQAMLLEPGTIDERLELAGALSKSPEQLAAILALLQEWFGDALLCRRGADPGQLVNADHADSLWRFAQQVQPHRLAGLVAHVSQLLGAQNHNINMQLGLESLLLQCRPAHSTG